MTEINYEKDAEFWNQKVGNAIDTIVEPIQLEREERINEVKQIRKGSK